MPVDAIGGIFVIFAAVIAQAAGGAGANRVSVVGLVLGALGAFLIYNGYTSSQSYLQPYLPYYM